MDCQVHSTVLVDVMDSRTKNDTLPERSSTGTSTLDSGCTTPSDAVPLTLTRKASHEDYNKIMAINIKIWLGMG